MSRNRLAAILFLGFGLSAPLAHAQSPAPTPPFAQGTQRDAASRCMLIAQGVEPSARLVQFAQADDGARSDTPRTYQPPEVSIRFAGHATYIIESPEGVRIATDYSGDYGYDPLPDVATMNHAHRTHWTPAPDPAIAHVLRGWGDGAAAPADHWLAYRDVLVRNVPTDIRQGATMEIGGNSIFIFEVADLCIGHLGHLHHPLTDEHYAAIGRLDIVMIPIDGGLTLSLPAMTEIAERLQSSVVLPMHRRFSDVGEFVARMDDDFAIDYLDGDGVTLSIRTLPRSPTVMIPRNL